ncbi:MAG: alanine--tRNA ligase-related protein, partial [Patescibacteria group bacterium]
FFEMLGNFSFGGYWKKEAIQYAYDFITKEMELKIDYVSVFKGEVGMPEDSESEKIWKEIDAGIEIRKAGRDDNFWGPTGEEGPCGPTTEIYVNGIEIWNIVFNEHYQNKDKTLRPLDIKGIDTGMGLERLAMVSQKVPTVFNTDLFDFAAPINTKEKRIIADHLRAASFMISDGVRPSNKEAGSVLRRLMRTIISYKEVDFKTIIEKIIDKYKNSYNNLNTQLIISEFEKEKSGYVKAYESAKKILKKKAGKELTGAEAFNVSSTLGIRISDILKVTEEVGVSPSPAYDEELEKSAKEHQEISKAGMEQKFKGGLAGHSEVEVKYHTATHLLHQALHDVLGDEVMQKGSNITPERLRFDFSFPRKMTEEEKRDVEKIVNDKIKASLPVKKVIMSKAEAEKTGARMFFGEKYPDEVSVYFIGDYSKEFCGGPHVENTGVLGEFKIIKEEAVAAGIRRIKAVLL